MTLSHGRKGQCWDSALSESFFASIKGELIDLQPWPTRAGARRPIVEYIAWYNGTRLHSTLGYKTPAEIRGNQQDQEGSLTESSALSVKAGNPTGWVVVRRITWVSPSVGRTPGRQRPWHPAAFSSVLGLSRS